MQWSDSLGWLLIGLVGQSAFFARFLVQWVASERAGRSFVPMSFWYLSLGGSLVLLVYAVHRAEPVFLLGQLPNAFVYVRNIMLIKRAGAEGSPSGTPAAAGPVGAPLRDDPAGAARS
jgi:lipid-A-disaccharide synthase-like uncharacterized protein